MVRMLIIGNFQQELSFKEYVMKIRAFLWVFLALATIFAFSNTARAADKIPKLGYYNPMEVAQQSVWGKKIVEQLKDEDKRASTELEGKSKPFRDAKEDWEKKRDVMDEKARTKRARELAEMQESLQKQYMEAKSKFEKMEQDLRAPFVAKMKEVLQKVAKADGYDYIMDKSMLGYSGPEKDDLTKRLIAEVDKSAPK